MVPANFETHIGEVCGCGMAPINSSVNVKSPRQCTEKLSLKQRAVCDNNMTQSCKPSGHGSKTSRPKTLAKLGKKSALRPHTPRAPHNSTQYLIENHNTDWDFDVYLGMKTSQGHGSCSSASDSDTTVHSSSEVVADFYSEYEPLDDNYEMQTFFQTDFEKVFSQIESEDSEYLNRNIFGAHEACPVLSYSSYSESDDGASGTTPLMKSSPCMGCESWSNNVTVNDSASQNAELGPTAVDCADGMNKGFLQFLSKEFEVAYQKSKEDLLSEKSVEELRNGILALEKKANALESRNITRSSCTLSSLRRELSLLQSENAALIAESKLLKAK